MEAWKITLIDGRILHSPDYMQIQRSNTGLVVRKITSSLEKKTKGFLWWKKEIEEEREEADTILFVPTAQLKSAEYCKIEEKA